VTIHGTNDVRVENNVTYNNIGHCFFLEDGIERGNQFVHNLGILTKCHPVAPCIPTNLAAAGETRTGENGQNAKDVLIPSDNTASTFWITNPDNVYRDNVAAGSEQVGFWIALPEHPTGAFEGTEVGAKTWPRRTKIREFKGNVAHSNYDGLIFDRGQDPKGHFNVGGNTNMAYADPEKKSDPLVSVIEDFTGYKNQNSGIWARGELHLFKDLKLADNAIGYTHAYPGLAPGGGAFTSKVIDSLFVGETDNIGNPRTATEMAYGRSLPKPELADFPIRGFEFYDYLHHVDHVTFRNFQDNATRKTGAISYLMYTSFGINPENSVEHAKFINAKPVYFPPTERKWGSDNFGSTGYKGAVFHDIDGSVGGIPNSYIVIDNGIADGSDACEIKPTWNAAVCKGDVGRMNVGSPGRGGFGGAPGPRPARVAAAGPGAAPARGGPAGPGAPGGRRGGFGGFGGGGNQPPVVLSRNGRDFTITGETTVPADTEIKVATERPKVSLSLRQLDKGAWIIFDLPGFTTAASGTQENSLEGLRKAKDTAYFKDKDALWVKVVSTGLPAGGGGASGFGGGTSVEVSR
jgi:cell migration-inducing and hyaluronan-binding protein